MAKHYSKNPLSEQSSKKSIKKKREEKRLKKLDKEGRLVKGVEIPKGTLAANPDNQKSSGYSIRYYYRDVDYKCAGCKKMFVWTKQQQKKYYEDQKGSIYNEAKWCYDCHKKQMEEKFGKNSD